MSYDASCAGYFSGRSNYYVYLYTRREATDIPNNRSSYYWYAAAVRSGGAISYALGDYPWSISIGPGYSTSGSHNMDFRNTSELSLGSGYTGWFGHTAEGYLTLANAISMGPASIFGSAYGSGLHYTDRIPKPPPAPVMISGTPDQIETTSMRVQFSSTGDGGSPVTSWALQRATDPAFTKDVVLIGSSGTSVVTGLNPGTRYYWRARGQNAAGVGAWSGVVSATTKSGVFIGSGGSFPGAECLVGVGGSFVVAEIWVPDPATETYVLAGSM